MPEKSATKQDPSSTSAEASNHDTSSDQRLRGTVPSPRNSLEIARIDLLRGYRWVRSQDFWLVFTVFMGAISAFLLWRTFEAARTIGSELTAGASVPAWLVTATGVIWLFLTVLLVGDGIGSNGTLENDGQYLTIRPTADIVGGKMIAAASKFSVYTIGPGLVAGAGLAAGAGSLFPVVGMLVAAVVVVVTAAAIGYPIGFLIKGIIRRSENLGRITTGIGVILGLAYVTLSVTGDLLIVVEGLEPVLQASPVAWFGHLALATTPSAGVNTTGALVLLGLTPVIVISGIRLAVPTARYAWLADATHTSDGETALPTAPDRRLDTVLNAVCRAPETRGIASTTLLRAVRSPLQFVFVAPPLLAAITFVEGAVTSGSVPWYVPWFVVWYGAWASGAVIPLNPLGNQGSTLSKLLTTPARGRHIVHGHVVAAVLIGAPLTAGVALGAGYLTGSEPAVLGALTLVSIGAVAGNAVVATGIGSVFPRFEAVSFDASRQAVPPSKRAYSLFSAYLSLTVVAVVVVSEEVVREVGSLLLSQWLPLGIEVSAKAIAALSWVVLAGSVLLIPFAYRVAIQRIETYQVQ